MSCLTCLANRIFLQFKFFIAPLGVSVAWTVCSYCMCVRACVCVCVHGWNNMEMIFAFMSKSVLVSCNTSKILGLALQQYLVIQTSALAVR